MQLETVSKQPSNTGDTAAELSAVKITNATCVLPDRILKDGSVEIADGKIKSISGEVCAANLPEINIQGAYLLPGLVDLHMDVLDKFIEPRPNTQLPLDIGMIELDKVLVNAGITTPFLCLALVNPGSRKRALRNKEFVEKVLATIEKLGTRLEIRPKIHVRLDVLNHDDFEFVTGLIEKGQVDLLSVMDHTPGQGQFQDFETYLSIMTRYSNRSEESLLEYVKFREGLSLTSDEKQLLRFVEHARKKGLIIASHDDDTHEKVDWAKTLGCTVSEFPINNKALRYAHNEGLSTIVGSPNIVFGGSHSNNLNAIDAIETGCADALCSDYLPLSVLHSIFILVKKQGMDLPQAVRMASLAPANMSGIGDITGSIEKGKKADMCIVTCEDGLPRVKGVIKEGRILMLEEKIIMPFIQNKKGGGK